MNLIGLMPVRNEDWVLARSARAALDWCDALVMNLHACTDNSLSIAQALKAEFPGRVRLMITDEPEWREMEHRQQMLMWARAGIVESIWGVTTRSEGATHIASIDADEILTPNLVPQIRGMIEDLDPGELLFLPWLAIRAMHWGTCKFSYIADNVDRRVVVAWKDDPRYYWSAEDRGGYQFHHRHPFVKGPESYQHPIFPLTAEQGGMMHLQFLSIRRLLAKQALYKMQELLRWPGKYFGGEDTAALLKVNALYDHTIQRLANPVRPLPSAWSFDTREMNIWDPEPWQLAECRRLIAEHGRERFAGLDLFGIV